MKMTKEQKIQLRKERRNRRNEKRKNELKKIRSEMRLGEGMNFRQARLYVRHGQRPYRCEMGYTDCELRGYCNGDC